VFAIQTQAMGDGAVHAMNVRESMSIGK